MDGVLAMGSFVLGGAFAGKQARELHKSKQQHSCDIKQLTRVNNKLEQSRRDYDELEENARRKAEQLESMQAELLHHIAQHNARMQQQQQELLQKDTQMEATVNKLLREQHKLQTSKEGLHCKLHVEQFIHGLTKTEAQMLSKKLHKANSRAHSLADEVEAAERAHAKLQKHAKVMEKCLTAAEQHTKQQEADIAQLKLKLSSTQAAATAAQRKADDLQQRLQVAEGKLEEKDNWLEAVQEEAAAAAASHAAELQESQQQCQVTQHKLEHLLDKFESLMRERNSFGLAFVNEEVFRQAAEGASVKAAIRAAGAFEKAQQELTRLQNKRINRRQARAARFSSLSTDSSSSSVGTQDSSSRQTSDAYDEPLALKTLSCDLDMIVVDCDVSETEPEQDQEQQVQQQEQGQEYTDGTWSDLEEVEFEAGSPTSSGRLQRLPGLAFPKLDMGLLYNRNQAMNTYNAYPLATCISAVFAAGGTALLPADLSNSCDTLDNSMAQHDSCNEEGAIVFLSTIGDMVGARMGNVAAAAAGDRMRQLMVLCPGSFEEGWRGVGMLLSGAVCACGGPAFDPRDMQRVLDAVAAVQEACVVSEGGTQVAELEEMNEAMQYLGTSVLSHLTAVL